MSHAEMPRPNPTDAPSTPTLPRMLIRDVMTHQSESVRPSDSVRAVAQVMQVRDVGFLPVVEDERVLGVVTDRDLTLRATAAGLDPTQTTVADVMTSEVFYCFDDEDVAAATFLMETKGVRRLVVFDRKMHLTGVLSIDDLSAIPGGAQSVGRTLRRLT